MTRMTIAACMAGLLLAQPAWAAEIKTVPVPGDEARTWVRYTTPLPKKIDISAKAVVPAADVAVEIKGEKASLVLQAAKELREVLGQAADAKNPAQPAFTLSLELGSPDAAVLKDLPRSDQAYLIQPTGTGLRLIALGQRGLYYASKTMQQLIQAKAREGKVEMPVVRITDWPDMEDRGLWGGDASQHLRWLSDRKMNYLEHISTTGVDKNKKCYVSYPPFKQIMIDEGPTYGINPVPVVLHLEQLKGYGLFDAYPELQGKDATEGVICYSNPKFTDILAEWLVLWGKTPGVTEVDVWMAENMYGKEACKCDDCKKTDRAVLEAQCIVKAWDLARKQLPNLGLRMLTSEASEDCNAKIIPTLPKDLKLWYYHSLFTYNTSRNPMIGEFQPYLIDAVKSGRWVGICPNLSAFVGLWMPMTSPVFIHARMTEFVDKGLEGLIGYAVPRIPYCLLHTEGAAEWTWNAKGRSPREFAVSFAVRQGYQHPEKFADWCDAMGPVSWDVYGSCFPAGEQRNSPGALADLLKQGKVPDLGEVFWGIYGIPFGDIKTVEQLNNNVAQAAKAVKLAGELGIPEYLHESLVVQGCIDAMKALYELKQIVKPDGVTDKPAAAKWFKAYADGLDRARKNLPLWEKAIRDADRTRMTDKAAELMTQMIDGMNATARDFGIEVK